MSRPSFCPNCGAALSSDEGTVAVPITDPETGDGGYDCYCPACDWSGDVYPDDEQGMEPSTHRREACR